MKKPRILAGIAMSLCLGLTFQNGAIAQAPNQSLSDQMDYLVAPLNFTEVTSEMLLDRGFPMMEIAAFDGSTNADTIFNFDYWCLQYAATYTGNVTASNTLDSVGTWKPQALHIRV